MDIIVILCEDWQDSCDAFDIFVSYLEEFSINSLLEVYESSNMVDTIEMDMRYRYVFVDRRYENWLFELALFTVEKDEFFEGVLEFYQWDI